MRHVISSKPEQNSICCYITAFYLLRKCRTMNKASFLWHKWVSKEPLMCNLCNKLEPQRRFDRQEIIYLLTQRLRLQRNSSSICCKDCSMLPERKCCILLVWAVFVLLNFTIVLPHWKLMLLCTLLLSPWQVWVLLKLRMKSEEDDACKERSPENKTKKNKSVSVRYTAKKIKASEMINQEKCAVFLRDDMIPGFLFRYWNYEY